MLRAQQSDTSCYNCIFGRILDSRQVRRQFGSSGSSMICRCLHFDCYLSERTFMEFAVQKDCRHFRRYHVERETV